MGIIHVDEYGLVQEVLDSINPFLPSSLTDDVRHYVANAVIHQSTNPCVAEATFILDSSNDRSLPLADTCLVAAGLFAKRLEKKVGSDYVDTVVGIASQIYSTNAAFVPMRSSTLAALANQTSQIVNALQRSCFAAKNQSIEDRYAHLLIGSTTYNA